MGNLKNIMIISVIIVICIPFILVGAFINLFGLEFLSGSTTYTGNGVTFNYPNEYNITGVNNNSTFLVGENTKNPNLTFQISKSPINGGLYNNTNLDEYAQSYEYDIASKGWKLMLVDHVTKYPDHEHDHVPAYSIYYDEKLLSKADPSSINGHIMIFDFNGTRYSINFLGKGKESQDRYASVVVMSSFKVI